MTTQISGDTGVSRCQPGSVSQDDLAANVVGNGPAFSAHATTTTSVPNNSATKVSLGGKLFDTANAFASDKFTAPIAGYYQFNFSVRMESITTLRADLRINGNVARSGSTASGAGYNSSGSHLVLLAVNDYVELGAYHLAGSTQPVTASQAETTLSGCLVRAA